MGPKHWPPSWIWEFQQHFQILIFNYLNFILFLTVSVNMVLSALPTRDL